MFSKRFQNKFSLCLFAIFIGLIMRKGWPCKFGWDRKIPKKTNNKIKRNRWVRTKRSVHFSPFPVRNMWILLTDKPHSDKTETKTSRLNFAWNDFPSCSNFPILIVRAVIMSAKSISIKLNGIELRAVWVIMTEMK